MKFLIDAQLPEKFALQLQEMGCDVIHTKSLPNGNRTTDSEIISIADQEDRIVITKDRDFRDSHVLHQKPMRLLMIETGNITNSDLMALIDKNQVELFSALSTANFVQLTYERLIVHE